MPGERDWGTNTHLNAYPLATVDPSEHRGAGIDTTGPQRQSFLYNDTANVSADGMPVRSRIDLKDSRGRQEVKGRDRPAKQKARRNSNNR